MPSETATSTKPSSINPGALALVEIAGTRIALANVDGVFYAFDDTCTHEECSLADGDLAGSTIFCVCHGAEFDVRTGQVLAPPAFVPLKVYPTRVEGDLLQIEV